MLFIFHVYLDNNVRVEWRQRCCRGGRLSATAALEQRRFMANRSPVHHAKQVVSETPLSTLVSQSGSTEDGSANPTETSDGTLPTSPTSVTDTSSEALLMSSRIDSGDAPITVTTRHFYPAEGRRSQQLQSPHSQPSMSEDDTDEGSSAENGGVFSLL